MSGIFGFSESEPIAEPLSAERCSHRRGLRGVIEVRLTDWIERGAQLNWIRRPGIGPLLRICLAKVAVGEPS
jgi:hypothetical protein